MYHEIKTERLLLRPFTPEDLEAVCQYTLDRENTRYTIWLPHRDGRRRPGIWRRRRRTGGGTHPFLTNLP